MSRAKELMEVRRREASAERMGGLGKLAVRLEGIFCRKQGFCLCLANFQLT
jgi:hypothetical protein